MAGKLGVLFALHFAVILVNFSGYVLRSEVTEDRRNVIDQFGDIAVTGKCGHLGFGRYTLYHTLISPSLRHVTKQKVKVGHLVGVNINKPRSDSVIIALSLLLSGDIHQCPGPVGTKRQSKFPCTCCGIGVRRNSKALSCDSCDKWTHIRCCNFPLEEYDKLKEGEETQFVCPTCCFSALPGDTATGAESVPATTDAEPEVEVSEPDGADDGRDDSGWRCLKKKGLHILHLNVRSLLPKITEVRNIAQRSNPAVLCFTETWLDDSIQDPEIQIVNYTCVRKDRNRNGGGVAVFVRNDVAFDERTEMTNNELEAVWIDILLPKTKPILLGACYRPPHQNNFYNLLENVCSNATSFIGNEVIITGDLNTNVSVSRPQGNTLVNALKSFCAMFDLHQIIHEPTRVFETNHSTIDLILVSDKDKISQSGVLTCGLSDHMITYCSRKVLKHRMHVGHSTVKVRSLKQYSKELFCDRLSMVNWSVVCNSSDVDQAWCNFKSIFLGVLDSIAPFRTTRVKQNSEPWFSGDILDMIIKRDKALRDFQKSKNQSKFTEFKKLRNDVQRRIDKAKVDYYKTNIRTNKNNPKKLWKSLKELGSSKTSKSNTTIGLNIDGIVSFDLKAVAKKFNSFFTTIASTLVNNLPNPTGLFGKPHIDNYYRNLNISQDSFALSMVNNDEVCKMLKTVDRTKATGLDNIPARFVSDAAEHIAPSITHIVNISLQQGKVPKDLKLAKVLPLYKKGSKTECGNYRPVSVLSIISKILERIVYNQLYEYVQSNNLFYDLQSGFRKSYSTDSCLIYLNDYLKEEIDNGNYCGMILIDLQKAFDTVNHEILLYKLKAIGCNNDVVEWMNSYLTGRVQKVNVNGEMSDLENITCGVPQGSILGPLLFLLYVNDMKSAVNCKLLLYADDSALLVSGKDVHAIERSLSMELSNISNWLVDNKLSLHLGKTESILFGSKRKLNKNPNLSIECNGTKILPKSNVKYLGAVIDQSVSGEVMASKVIQKVSSRTKFLARKAKYLDRESMKLLASALVQCHFDYSCSSWYSSLSKATKNKLQTCQNKLIRTVLKLHPRTHIDHSHYKLLNWLPVEKRVNQLKLGHVHKVFNGNSPLYLSTFFTNASTLHRYATRFSQASLVVPRYRCMIGKSTFKYTGAIEWNKLPLVARQITDCDRFKTYIKSHFLDVLVQEDSSIYAYQY